MNLPTLMTRLAALQGHPIPVSTRSAPFDDHDSEVAEADPSQQLPRVPGVRVVRNIEFARRQGADGSTRPLRLDLMIPQAPGPHPLVVFVPGGGFVMAVKAGGARMRRALAARGFAVASIEYRTTRHGATVEDALDDVAAALQLLTARAAEYAIDARRVGLWGESAGGYLVSMAGVTRGHPRWGEGGSSVRAVVDKFGASDLFRIAEGFDPETAAQVFAPGNALARFVVGPTAETLEDDIAAVHAADPARSASREAAAFLLFHGSDDRIISPVQTSILHDALRAAGARSRRVLVRGAGHGDIAVKGGEERYWTTVPMLDLIATFFRDELTDGAA
ncbi:MULTISPECIES: prolyl oligopeptidase family serine peptidase [unclassified Microbacterium]|uniref:prolyl oligopeptidase family serine peptidase n=1 Tax=unclassified Microbacterium TaxID=2609290 RepID=UPI00364E4D10